MQKRCFPQEIEDENLFEVVSLDSIQGRFARSSWCWWMISNCRPFSSWMVGDESVIQIAFASFSCKTSFKLRLWYLYCRRQHFWSSMDVSCRYYVTSTAPRLRNFKKSVIFHHAVTFFILDIRAGRVAERELWLHCESNGWFTLCG